MKTPIILTAVIAGSVAIAAGIEAKISPSVTLPVPYVAQAADGRWIAPWDEACEEASILMVERYYTKSIMTVAQTRARMQWMFGWENAQFKKNDDTNAEETVQLIENHASFRTSIQRNPTREEIQEELHERRPVIALVSMFELYREKDAGDSYHVVVLIGYDEKKQEFILHDPARKSKSRYPYDVVMKALHDFDAKSGEARGEPTVLFTRRR